MADRYTAYTDLYNYMNRIMSEIQTRTSGPAQTKSQTRVSGQSFYDTFQNTLQKLNAPASMDSIFEEAAQIYNVPLALLKAVGKQNQDLMPVLSLRQVLKELCSLCRQQHRHLA